VAVYVYPEQFERCVALLTQRLQTMASRGGVADEDCADLQSTLAALPPFSRDRASVMLQGVRAQTGRHAPLELFRINVNRHVASVL
jgi:hypothetical protein